MKHSPLLRRWSLVALGGLFAPALATFLVTSNVRWTAGSVALWGALFDRNHVVERTGIPKEELMRGARQIQDYFNTAQEPLTVVVRVGGVDQTLFNDREVAHMADVKQLFRGTFRVQEIVTAVLVGILVGGLARYRRRFLRPLARMVMAGGGITIAFVVLVGLASAVNFDAVFTSFHILSFSNDLWELNPAASYLVRMFPQGFWLDISLLIGLVSAVEAAILMGGAFALLKLLPAETRGPRRVSADPLSQMAPTGRL